MAEENIFLLTAGACCRRPVVTCLPDEDIVAVAAIMSREVISSVVVQTEGVPNGIITDRDLRNKVVARRADPGALRAREVMTAPLITVAEEDFLFEALYRMSRHAIHRVGVVDQEGKLVGILTDSDILRLQSRSPQQMIRAIEEAESLDNLKILHGRIQDLVVHLVGTGVATRDLVRMIAHLNDRLVLRVIALLQRDRFSELPGRFAFIVLGSEGRREQTLTTDQDNAIVYGDELEEEAVERLAAFARELTAGLIAIGIPSCPGGIMAKNEAWRRSLRAWTKVLDLWLSRPVSENILAGSMFFDLRTLYGDPTLEGELKAHVYRHLQHDEVFLVRTAANVLRFRPPFGWFGRIKVERGGEHRGMVDIKKAGIFAITEGIKVLALEAGILDGGTRERMTALADAGILDRDQSENLLASFDFLVHLRLRGQVTAIRGGREPTNHLSLDQLNRMEMGRLRLALKEVGNFQDFLKRHYRLDLIR